MIDGISKCKPSKLMPGDMVDFPSKCRALQKDKITSKNINESLDKLTLLNIPFGGVSVDDYIHSTVTNTNANISKLNTSLIDLLVNGILPMNQMNIYHGDIKEQNILVLDKEKEKEKEKEFKTRLIDWGLSCEYVPGKGQRIPATWRNAPLQFNLPFSVIIITDSFVDMYSEYIRRGGKIDASRLKPFVEEYIHYWFKKRGVGHYRVINEIMYYLFNHDIQSTKDDKEKWQFVEHNYTLPYIVNYIVEILVVHSAFSEDGRFFIKPYIDNVFVKLVDVWGLVISYNPLLEVMNQNYNNLSPQQMKVFKLLKSIFIIYLFRPQVKPINIPSLVKQLSKISNILDDRPRVRNKSSLVSSAFASAVKNKKNMTRKRFAVSVMSHLKKRISLHKRRGKRIV